LDYEERHQMTKHKPEDKRKVPIEFEAPVEESGREEPVEQDTMAADIDELEREIETLRKSVEETQFSYLRVLADFDNFRKRQREETARLTSSAREQLILKLLPIVDNFDRTLAAAEAEHSYESLVEGVTLTLKQVREMLEREGLEPIEAVGQEFNPELHEALMRVETDDYPENTVVDEIEKGYTLNGKLLRPARVRVAATG
jgi:molecular chaperone GrpE